MTDKLNGTLQEVNWQCADHEDWSQCCFPLGLKVAGRDSPWLEFTPEELYTLELMLSKQLPIEAEAGKVHYLDPLRTTSKAFENLAQWARAVRMWALRNAAKVDQ